MDKTTNLGGQFQWDCIGEWLYHRLHLVQHRVWDDRHAYRIATDRAAWIDELLRDLCNILQALIMDPEVADPERYALTIQRRVCDDRQIDHLIWEVALEDVGEHDHICDQLTTTILAAVNPARPRSSGGRP